MSLGDRLIQRDRVLSETSNANRNFTTIRSKSSARGKSWWEERVDPVTRAVEAVSVATQNAENEAKQDQPKSFSNEWVPLWVPQQEAKIASC